MRGWLVTSLLVACGDNLTRPDGPETAAPPLRNPVSLGDNTLALEALRLLGANVDGAQTASCNNCHGLTKRQLESWGTMTDRALATCLTDPDVSSRESAREMIDCMRVDPTAPRSDFQAKKLGVFAAAGRLPWFDYTFEKAYAYAGAGELAKLQTLAAMPREGLGFTQEQFDIVAEWFVRGLPALDETLGTAQPPAMCTASIDTAAINAHVTAMATTGWSALNKQAQLAMHGCGAATDPHDCLQSYTRATAWEVAGHGVLRILAQQAYTSLFWTRSSADGRFVAHGVQSIPGSYVIDLQRAVSVPIEAEFDPAFFPDNSGFVFQGAPRNTCAQSVLTSNPASITMMESGCRNNGAIGLYEQLGRLGPSGDHVALDALFVTDDGGKLPTLGNPPAQFGATARMSFTPLVFDGTTFVPRATVVVSSPFEGDTVLSPSTRMLISRMAGPDDRQIGYALREVAMTPSGNTYGISLTPRAFFCVTGGKPSFSYDERWIVFHHYVETSDAIDLGFSSPASPAFAPYLTQGASNLYLLALATGAVVRITNMGPGQYALFPHFRSDGWIYFQVRDLATGHETTVASDAAL